METRRPGIDCRAWIVPGFRSECMKLYVLAACQSSSFLALLRAWGDEPPPTKFSRASRRGATTLPPRMRCSQVTVQGLPVKTRLKTHRIFSVCTARVGLSGQKSRISDALMPSLGDPSVSCTCYIKGRWLAFFSSVLSSSLRLLFSFFSIFHHDQQ